MRRFEMYARLFRNDSCGFDVTVTAVLLVILFIMGMDFILFFLSCNFD